ncbi:bifunctional tetrahydrofolate synthase/dihydrofolate synthase [Zoogloea sp.]|uniref:bifunctional tetrahydrofolate synthase/dihydrofolate synthase n=1 Tax=Zoogloea sp. TaxID=49181 RepID=UPI00261ABDBD|nr:bifunctional tetrahydrofolate synthase/dihydrofolate synthase [Zoogloea sp.]MDD3353231.1 bifunctional tetrahydrofolate synthase/dihydrofolate synthase [Zoogloea sp.]
MQLPETLEGWLSLLEHRHGQSIELGLERVRSVKDALNLPQTCPVFLIGGTNGKGSTCALLEAVLLAAGYRVGVYTSPHLLAYNERVRIDGRDAPDEVLVAAFAEVEHARGEIPLTYFEHGTLAAWVAFAHAGLDAVILEVGLGGRLDAVNVFEPACSIVTSVAMDHMEYLGDTREAIGFEKAGIFRAGRPAICGDPMPPVSLVRQAETLGARLWVSGRDFGFAGDQNQWAFWLAGGSRRGGLAYPALRGTNQLLNAAAVMAACESVRDILPVSMQAIRQGFMLVDLPGRFQVLPGRPAVVLDVAHNPQAAGVLNENLASMGFFPETWAVLGMLSDKDVAGSVTLLKDRVDHWLVASLPAPRGLAASALARILRDVGVTTDISEFAGPAAAYEHARGHAAEGDRIVVFGSFLTVSDVMVARKAP